jgi:NTE family protein
VLKVLLRRNGNSRGDRTVEAETEGAARPSRPTIGIALSGGAARGFVHIGVLQTLLAHGLKPDVVTGTSMGAVVGGCYAAGKLGAIADWARSLTRRRVFGYLDVSLNGSGLINGTRLARQLEHTIGKIRIESLDTRFAAIATEIETGHEVWLTRGRLLEALRASYALPGVFAPMHIGGRWLLDGALVNPVPVSTARALDARLVIGVNANAELFGRGITIQNHGFEHDPPPAVGSSPAEIGGWRARWRAENLLKRKLFGHPGRLALPAVVLEAYSVMQDRITRARLAGDPADILMNPRLGDIGMFDFHRAEEAIQIGAEAAERSMEQIEQAIEVLSY